MELTVSHKILPELEIIVEYYKGKLTFDGIKKFKRKLFEDEAFDPSFNYISDFRDVEFDVEEDEILQFAIFEKEQLVQKNKKIHSAIITNTPDQVVSTTLYSVRKENVFDFIKVFSSLNAAMDWCRVSLKSRKLVKEAHDELNNSSRYII